MIENKLINKLNLKELLLKYGLYLFLVVIVVIFSIIAPYFMTFKNFNGLFHAAAPLLIISGGLAFIVFTGKLDISLGSIAYLSCCVGAILMKDFGMNPILALAIIILVGILCGAINGFIITVLKINPFITTLGTMIAFRGVGYIITQSYEIRMPVIIRDINTWKIGGIFFDIWLALIILIILFCVHKFTVYGRHIMAMGNGEESCKRLGIRVDLLNFITFTLAGFLSSIAGIVILAQVGELMTFLGKGMEFTAVAAIVLGGISLFGGEGTILPGVLLGTFILEMIRNGLNHIGANPYLYEFVNGGIIFVAMFIDALKSQSKDTMKLIAED